MKIESLPGHRIAMALGWCVVLAVLSACGGGGAGEEAAAENTAPATGSTAPATGTTSSGGAAAPGSGAASSPPAAVVTGARYARWLQSSGLSAPVRSGDPTGFPVHQAFVKGWKNGYTANYLFISDGGLLDKRSYTAPAPSRDAQGDWAHVMASTSLIGGNAGYGYIWVPVATSPYTRYFTDDFQIFAEESSGTYCEWDGHAEPEFVDVSNGRVSARDGYSTWTCRNPAGTVTSLSRRAYSAVADAQGNLVYTESVTTLTPEGAPTGTRTVQVSTFSPQLELLNQLVDQNTRLSDGSIYHMLGKLNATF